MGLSLLFPFFGDFADVVDTLFEFPCHCQESANHLAVITGDNPRLNQLCVGHTEFSSLDDVLDVLLHEADVHFVYSFGNNPDVLADCNVFPRFNKCIIELLHLGVKVAGGGAGHFSFSFSYRLIRVR